MNTAANFSVDWKSLFQTISYVAAAIAAIMATRNYHRSFRLERAKWVAALYTKFYEQPDLKKVREVLDCETPDAD